MEDLTESLQKALQKGEPLRLRDPRSDQIYILVREEVYQRVVPFVCAVCGSEGPPAAVVLSRLAFLRELPSLLQSPKYDRWCVAYCGNERIALAPSEQEVIDECLRRGLKRNQYYIGVVAAYDHEPEIERSLYEFDPI